MTAPVLLGVTNDIFPESGAHYVTIWMQAESPGGDVTACSEEVDMFDWFTTDALPSPLFLSLENLLKGHGVQPIG